MVSLFAWDVGCIQIDVPYFVLELIIISLQYGVGQYGVGLKGRECAAEEEERGGC